MLEFLTALFSVLFVLESPLRGGQPEGDSYGKCDIPAYTVGIQDSSYFNVRLRFRARGHEERLFMAENSPGATRQVYARFLEALHAESEERRELFARRVGASTWEIGTEPDRCVSVDYLVHRYLDDPVRLVSNAIDPHSAYFVGATMILGIDGYAGPAKLTVMPPSGESVWTTLPSDGGGSFHATSYQELAQAPVLIGNTRPLDIALEDGILRILTFEAPSDTDPRPFETRFGEIARCQQRIFGFSPARLILVALRWRDDLDYGGGVSRREAVVMNIGREWMSEPARFATATFAHELFHTWNFGLFYPAGTKPWQPFAPTATRSFWLVEGLTNYYVLQTLVRLGRLDLEAARDWISEEITNFETSPARAWASLEDGGPMTDAGSAGIDVRAGGFVTGFVLDSMIRRDTESRASLDDLIRLLASSARADGYAGYSEHDIEEAVRSVGGDGVAAAYRRIVSQTGSLDYNELLQDTAYRVERIADETVPGGQRWRVVDVRVSEHTRASLSVFAISCDGGR